MADQQNRRDTINKMFRDLAALDLGTDAQRRAALESFYDTHMTAIDIYREFGDISPKLQEDVQSDSTHTWLDTTVGGKTIRQRIIDRLNNPVGV